jgi:hypothetical protein
MHCNTASSVIPMTRHLPPWRVRVPLAYLLAFTAHLATDLPAVAAEPATPPDLFATTQFGAVLGFDLRNNETPVATVLITRNSGQAGSVDLALPFKIKQASQNEAALFRVGAFNRWTLITYSNDPAIAWPQQISFSPGFDVMPEPRPQNNALSGSLYFQNEGQVWRFLYRYPDPRLSHISPAGFSTLSVRPFDAIAVAIPDNARLLQVHGNPQELGENAHAQFYPSARGPQAETFLDIEYLMPPTTGQRLAVKYAGKAGGAFAPLISALLARLTRRRWRLLFILTTVAAYFALFVLLVMYVSRAGEIGDEAIAEFALLGISGVVALIVMWLGGVDERAPAQRLTTPTAPRASVSVQAPVQSSTPPSPRSGSRRPSDNRFFGSTRKSMT